MGGPRVRDPLKERITSFYRHVCDDERTPERLFLLGEIINTELRVHFAKELVASIVWLMRRCKNSFYRHLHFPVPHDFKTGISYDRFIDNLKVVFDSVSVGNLDYIKRTVQLDLMVIHIYILNDRLGIIVDEAIPIAMDALMMCLQPVDFKCIRRKFGKDLSAWHHLYENYEDTVNVS